MGRRRRDDEIAFGSDSFLDIVANIVGILIILIVIAGVRVSQMPAVVVSSDPKSSSVPTPSPRLSMVADEPAPLADVTSRPAVEVPSAPQEPLDPPAPILPPPEVVARLHQLTDHVSRLEQTRQLLAAELTVRSTDAETLRQQAAARRTALAREQQSTENGRRAVSSLQTELDTGLRRIAGLHLELAEVEASAVPHQILRHKLTPVAKVVDGEEVHFLLARGGVAVVPVDELGQKLQEELLRKKSQLIRGQTRVGSVGPVKGFTLEYVVEREAISLMEELRVGTAVIRLGISEWRILPQSGAVFETADEALLPQSRFLNALRAAGANATVTFWVYPDSFALHRELQDFAHDNGFDVAARPLPEGIPITGSKHGTRSVSQ